MNVTNIKTPEPMSNEEYWEMHSQGPELEVLDKCCHDCAIKTGFYIPYAEELSEQPIEIQNKAVKRWFCHNHTNKACRGAYNYIKSKQRIDESK